MPDHSYGNAPSRRSRQTFELSALRGASCMARGNAASLDVVVMSLIGQALGRKAYPQG